MLQTPKLLIRASARTCANSFLLLIVKCPMPARKPFHYGEINPFIVYHSHIFLLGACLWGHGCLLLAYLVVDKVEEDASRRYFCFSLRDSSAGRPSPPFLPNFINSPSSWSGLVQTKPDAVSPEALTGQSSPLKTLDLTGPGPD